MESLLLFTSGIAVISILMVPVSAKVRAPILLLFLGLGVFLGEDGPGQIYFDSFDLVYSLGSVCLAIILLFGGLDIKLAELKTAVRPAGVLATVGVVLTAAIVGVLYALIFDAPLVEGLLLGAVVGSTDAAATFMLLSQSGVKLQGRLKETLFIESGLNDPIAIFLTVTFVGLVDADLPLSWDAIIASVPLFFQQIGLGAVGGVLGGVAVSRISSKVQLPRGLNSPFFLVAGLFTYALVALVGGSGFLAIYLYGVVVANYSEKAHEGLIHFHEGLAWLAQIAMFVMLGLLVTPSALPEVLLVGIVMAAVLMFLARPLAVMACLAPFGFSTKEQLYVGWVGLRGAVPIFLAIIPVISPGPLTPQFFNIVFIIVVASLVLQGWTVSGAAHIFGVTEKDTPKE
ncbi:potassium/proton antiporter [Kordiimonas pumila]|uniref:Potassium/proton antiporter n=1 Tax=Kordiimonas pumila TaxID=2161677 RepID=A0ABV7D7M6_9PROT|nr:potassium/proton antiporter [Kordiimonas pumila]